MIASINAGKASDAAGNGNTASTSTDNTVTYDPEPPAVSNVAVNPTPTNGTIAVTATAKVDDAATGNSKIVSAEYSIDGGTPVAMNAADGSFNSATENVTAIIPAAVVAALPAGRSPSMRPGYRRCRQQKLVLRYRGMRYAGGGS